MKKIANVPKLAKKIRAHAGSMTASEESFLTADDLFAVADLLENTVLHKVIQRRKELQQRIKNALKQIEEAETIIATERALYNLKD